MGAIGTGVKASDEDRDAMMELAKEAQQIPVMKFGSTWLHEAPQARLTTAIDELAVKYGLPPPEKDADGDVIHYGMTKDGEFTKWDGT